MRRVSHARTKEATIQVLAPVEAPAARRADDLVITDTTLRPTGVRRALAWYGASRLVVLLGVWVGTVIAHDPGRGPWPTVSRGPALVRGLARWDGAWYLWLARRWYPNAHQPRRLKDLAFFPLFPTLVRWLSPGRGTVMVLTAVALSLVVGAVAVVAMRALLLRLAPPEVAGRAVALVCFFPGSFVLGLPYTEAIFLAAAAGCLVFLLDRRWVLAGVAGALAAASRPTGWVVVVACAAGALLAWRRARSWRAWTAPVLASGGVVGVMVFLWVRAGDPLAWLRSERVAWHDHFSVAVPLVRRFATVVVGPRPGLQPTGLNDVLGDVGLVLAVVALVAVARSSWPAVVRVFTSVALVVPLLSNAVGPRPRMLLAGFPAAALLAARLTTSRRFAIAMATSGALLLALTVVSTATLAATP